MEQKSFDPVTLASLTSGILMGGTFGDMHEAAEWVMGHPIWTHEFADKAIFEKMATDVLAQFPELPTNGVVNQDNYQEMAAIVKARYGDSVMVTKGSGVREKNPLETLDDILQTKAENEQT